MLTDEQVFGVLENNIKDPSDRCPVLVGVIATMVNMRNLGDDPMETIEQIRRVIAEAENIVRRISTEPSSVNFERR